MIIGRALIFDRDAARLASAGEWLRAHRFEALEAASENVALAKAQQEKPDVALLRVESGVDIFHKLAAVSERAGTLMVPFIERRFSADFRKEVLALKADGFINDEAPWDEWIAAISALIRRKRVVDELRRATAVDGMEKFGSAETNIDREKSEQTAPLRDRRPELYQDILRRYEEGVKRVLQHRIYKINDDVFEPFRQIAKELFLANATARDAVQLHYLTLRKIAPTPDAPRAQAYLEVGRTTIIGLMGDLLTFYRDAQGNEACEENSYSTGSAERLTKQF